MGRQPQGFIGGTKSSFLEALGDTAVDFDFGPAEIEQETPMMTQTPVLAKTLSDSMGYSGTNESIFIKHTSSTIGKFGIN